MLGQRRLAFPGTAVDKGRHGGVRLAELFVDRLQRRKLMVSSNQSVA